MTTDKQAVKVRLGDHHRAILDSLAIQLGLSKNAVIEHLLDSAKSVKATPVESIPVFYRDQTLDARSRAYHQVFAQFEHKQILGSKTYYHHAGLKLVCELEAKTKDTPQKLRVWLSFPDDELHINDDGTFLRYKGKQIEWFTKREIAELEAIAAPTAALKVVNKEIAIEVAIDAPTPTIERPIAAELLTLGLDLVEPTILTKDEFRQKFSLDDAAYSLAGMDGKPDAGGWLAPSGERWFVSGGRKNRTWSLQPALVAV